MPEPNLDGESVNRPIPTSAVATRPIVPRFPDVLLASANHQLRTPLHVIIGYVEMLLDSELSPEQRDTLQRVRSASVDLAYSIEWLLNPAWPLANSLLSTVHGSLAVQSHAAAAALSEPKAA